MQEYNVVWRMPISGESPTDAARRALEIQRDPESIATVFEVDGKTIDLDNLDSG